MKLPALLVFLIATSAQADQASVDVCFTPSESCEPQIVRVIDQADRSIRVQAYYLTSLPIIHALQRAEERGVDVEAVLDKVNEKKYSGATLLAAKGVPVFIDRQPAIAHNKLIIIDEQIVVGGSFNYTASAEKRNVENVTFMKSKGLARQFLNNWESRKQVSDRFEVPASSQ